tara:strand:- start:1503 stop:1826 length:324 start_codon:yes stop_codon:yes gene_type:complete
MIEPRKWPENVDPTLGKSIGIVTAWCNNTSSGRISSINGDGSILPNVVVSGDDVVTLRVDKLLIVGEELEHYLSRDPWGGLIALNVSGPRNTYVQIDNLHSDIIGLF